MKQKHVRVADHSERGWGVVAAYESDELAEISNDEKRMFRAEKETERRQLKKNQKQNSSLVIRKRVTETAGGPEGSAGRGRGVGSRPPPNRLKGKKW